MGDGLCALKGGSGPSQTYLAEAVTEVVDQTGFVMGQSAEIGKICHTPMEEQHLLCSPIFILENRFAFLHFLKIC